MPACDARYDVIFSPAGSGLAVHAGPRNRAVVDMEEERQPDDWGEPGRLVSAKLAAWKCPYARTIEYDLAWGKRMALWVDGRPRLTRSTRQYLRWKVTDYDPPIDPEYDDPA